MQEQKTALGYIKHSRDCSHDVQAFTIKSNKGLISEIDKQIAKCLAEIKRLVDPDNELECRINKLPTIKDIGMITMITILAETMGFDQFHSAKQLVSYAGYDVVQRESGASVKGRTRISKKGNRYIRNALYFPAMVACQYNPTLKETYIRIIKNKSSKMIGQVAIQKELLILMYTTWNNDTVFIENYKVSSPDQKIEATQDNSVAELLRITKYYFVYLFGIDNSTIFCLNSSLISIDGSSVTVSRNQPFFQPCTLALQIVIVLKINISKHVNPA